MPIDDRSDLERLTRSQTYQEADAWGISYPQDLPKSGMILLLEGAGVNRHNMKTIKWRTEYPSEQERAAAAHQGVATSEQHYPLAPVHQSARDGVDSMALLHERLAQAEARDDLQKDELKRLKDENAHLRAALSRLDSLEAKIQAQSGVPAPSTESGPKRRQRLLKEAKTKGLSVDNTTTLAEVESLLGLTG